MASKKSKTPTLTKKLRKRIENIAIQVIEAAGATYEHITKSEWGIIINEIAAETKLIEKNDFEIRPRRQLQKRSPHREIRQLRGKTKGKLLCMTMNKKPTRNRKKFRM
jgi:hypothetical protein